MSIEFKTVSYTYSANTPFEFAALKDVDLNLRKNKITAIIGATGSGKSTLVQHLNALILPTSGELVVDEFEIKAGAKVSNLKNLRKKVGLVFQFPEYQLFEETNLKDVAFGPKNFGINEVEALDKAMQALKVVGLSKDYEKKSPLDLSGGQKRRVAIAGILAMDPDVLVLDEPTAGLDPQGAIKMMELFGNLNKDYGKTVLIVTHDMEHVYNYCDDVVVMKNGAVHLQCSVDDFFGNSSILNELNILPPYVIRVKDKLQENGFKLDKFKDFDDLCNQIIKEIK